LIHPDMRPLSVFAPYTKRLVSKHLLKLNSTMKFGSFSIDPNGSIKFQSVSSFDLTGACTLASYADLEKWFKINYATTTTTMKKSLIRVLKMAELISLKQYSDVTPKDSDEVKKIPTLLEDSEKYMIKILTNFTYRLQDKFKSEDKVEKTNVYNRNTVRLMNNFPPDIKNYVGKVAWQYQRDESYRPKDFKKEESAYESYYKEIEITHAEYKHKLSSGGYGDVYTILAEYKEKGEKNIKTQTLIAKVPKKDGLKNQPSHADVRRMPEQDYVVVMALNPTKEVEKYQVDTARIDNERKVIRYPAKKNFPFMATYFDDTSKSCIFMEPYLSSNLHSITSKHQFGLTTVFSWAFQISQYLKFAKDYGIVHLDFKPENICLNKKFQCKVIDFAESYVRDPDTFEIKTDDMSRGHTIPYTAPEIFQDSNKGFIESDVFSFGHIVYVMLFHKKIFGVKRSSNSKLIQKYKSLTYKALSFKNNMMLAGPKYIMKYCYFAIMFCLSTLPINRMSPEDLLLIYEELFKLTERLF
jgi:tRNA A-37 threonylcarbamoyl transferase component Bud32